MRLHFAHKGHSGKHLRQDNKHHVTLVLTKKQRLRELTEEVQAQFPELNHEEAEGRAIFRYACLHPASWKVPLAIALGLLTMILVLTCHAQDVNINRVGGTLQSGANVVDLANSAFRMNCVTGCGGAASFLDSAAFTAALTPISLDGGVFNDGLSAITAGNAAAFRITAQRGLHVNIRNAAGTEMGTVSNPWNENTAQWLGSTAPTVGQKTSANSIPVVISSDQSSLAFDPQGPDAQGATQTGKPVQNGGLNYSDGKIYTLGVDSSGRQQMAIIGTVTLGNLPQQPFLNTTDFSDVLAGTPATGSTIFSNATPKWAALVGSTLSAGGGFYNETQGVLAAPSSPVLTVSNTGGVIQQASGQVEYVVVTLVNAFGETTASAETSIAVSIANGCLAASTTCSVTVTAPTLTGNATGYSVYSDRDATGEQRQDSGSACVNITINCVIQGSGTGVSPPTINTASNGTLVVPIWKASTGTGNVVNATGATLSAKSLNNTVYADQYPGDICAAISRAWLDLPATGGTIDATGFQGSQTCASEPFIVAVDNSNKPFDLALGAVTINSTVSWYVPSNFHIHGVGDAITVIAFQPAGGAAEATKADLFHTNGTSNIEIDHIKFTGTANTSRIISLASGSNVRFHHNTISGAKYLAVAGPSCPLYIDAMSDVWIENNIFTANGPGPASGTSTTNADICTWTASAENRIHIRNNQISGSFEEVSIMMFDCLDCDLLGNDINQNNQITTTLTKGGYGIAVYGSVARPTNVRVEANFVKNCAGTCIYLASNDRAAVVGNTVSTCGQQETDGSLPVACIAANDCGNCTIDNNTATTSTKDGITVVAPAVGTVVSGNTMKTITQYGMNSRTATDMSWINNTVQTSTLDWFRDTGARNLVALNHALTSGAATTVATDYLLGNCIDATGCAFTFDAPANKTGETDIVADSGAINTTETVIVKTPALIASRLLAGSHIRITLTGTCTSTAANVSTFTLRWGTNGTTADGTVAALASSVAAVSGTNNGFRAVIDLTVRTAGASATSSAFMELMSDGNIGIVATPNEKFVAGTAFATTTASGILSLAYKSAATTTTSTFKNATIEVVYQ